MNSSTNCASSYEDYRVEYSAEGDLLVTPPTDPETSARNLEIAAQLIWQP